MASPRDSPASAIPVGQRQIVEPERLPVDNNNNPTARLVVVGDSDHSTSRLTPASTGMAERLAIAAGSSVGLIVDTGCQASIAPGYPQRQQQLTEYHRMATPRDTPAIVPPAICDRSTVGQMACSGQEDNMSVASSSNRSMQETYEQARQWRARRLAAMNNWIALMEEVICQQKRTNVHAALEWEMADEMADVEEL